jgi:branched-subunit amino acid transport protein AzlD
VDKPHERPVVGEVLRVASAGTTLDDAGRAFPTVVIDVASYPTLAAVTSVLAHEGMGDLATVAALALDEQGRRSIVLTVTAATPVALEFSIGFPLPGFSRLLEEAAAAGCLVVACSVGDPSQPVGDTWLGVDLDGAALAELIRWAD